MAERRLAGAGTDSGRKSTYRLASSSSASTRPPSGKNRNVAQELISKEEEYM